MFRFITMNWRGKPLTSVPHHHRADLGHDHVNRTAIQAGYDPGWYPKGLKITDRELAALPLAPCEFHGEWNYTLNAQSISA
jgi:hypothetical protein